MTNKREALLACFALLGFALYGCGRSGLMVTQEPVLIFPPGGIQADETITGEVLMNVWNIRTVPECLPKWESFRIVETLSPSDGVIIYSVYEQMNTDPPKARKHSQNFSKGLSREEVQIGEEYWQHVRYGKGKEDLYYLDFGYLVTPTGFDWLIPAIIEDVRFVGEEIVDGFKTQHYTLLAVDPTAFGTVISGDFWLSKECQFIVRAEWELSMGTFGSGIATYELTDIDVPVEVFPPPTPPNP